MIRVEKVCPYVLRTTVDRTALLVFRHPLAGIQIVKGTLEADESIAVAALRELREESGITGAIGDGTHWSSRKIADDQIWHFVPVVAPPLPERFAFHTADDGGHLFRFFWWPLEDEPDQDWHPIFVRALQEIRQHAG